MFIKRCILLYTVAFFPCVSIRTGAPYNRNGRTVPLCMVYRASWASTQIGFGDFDVQCINFVQLPDMYIMCSLKFNLLSKCIAKYLVTSSESLIFMQNEISLFSFLFRFI